MNVLYEDIKMKIVISKKDIEEIVKNYVVDKFCINGELNWNGETVEVEVALKSQLPEQPKQETKTDNTVSGIFNS